MKTIKNVLFFFYFLKHYITVRIMEQNITSQRIYYNKYFLHLIKLYMNYL